MTDEPLAKMLFGQLAAGAQWLGDCGVVHKDLKPDNIMLTKPFLEGRVLGGRKNTIGICRLLCGATFWLTKVMIHIKSLPPLLQCPPHQYTHNFQLNHLKELFSLTEPLHVADLGGIIKIIDFGLAILTSDQRAGPTA